MESTITFAGGSTRYLPFNPEADTIVLALQVADYDGDCGSVEEWVVAWHPAGRSFDTFATRVGDFGVSFAWERHPDAPILEVKSVYDWAAVMQQLVDEIDEHSYGRNTDAERTRAAEAWPALAAEPAATR